MLRTKKIETKYRQAASVVRAMNMIWYHPDSSLNLDKLSSACNVSKYHFHRIFNEHQGETLNAYVARKRIERVAHRMVMHPYYSISDIAKHFGFSSPANFAKAFKLHFGITAREYRNPHNIDYILDGKLKSEYGKDINPLLHHSKFKYLNQDAKNMRLQQLDQIASVTYMQKQKLIYRNVNDGCEASSWAPKWKETIAWAQDNYDAWQDNMFSVWYDNPNVCPNSLIRQDVALRVPNNMEVNPPFMTQTMEAGMYATGIIKGSLAYATDIATDINMFWLVERGLIPDFKPFYIQHLSKFLDDKECVIRFYIKVHSCDPIAL